MQNALNPSLRLFRSLSLIIVACFGLGACTISKDPYIQEGEIVIYDPFEEYNRTMTDVNNTLDDVIFDPAVMAYRSVVPEIARTGVSNVLDHVRSPVYLANEVLQGDWEDAQLVVFRFVVNTFAGFLGLIDVADWEGHFYEGEDFGQTMAIWGVGQGPYIVWPVFGPGTPRSATGRFVDMAFDPLFWYGMQDGHEGFSYAQTGLTILDTQHRFHDAREDLKANSLDYYAALRSIFYQRRAAMIYEDRGLSQGYIEIPDYE